MIGFIKYLWEDYKRELKINKAKDEFGDFIKEMKIMTSKEMEDKWGSPTKHFTDLKWKIYCIKNDIVNCDNCHKYHKISDGCLIPNERSR